MTYTFTPDQLALISFALEFTDESLSDKVPGKYHDVYSLIYEMVTDTSGLYHSPVEGLEENVWTWIGGARDVNSGTGYFANFIREYTRSQHEFRYRETISDEELNIASNKIARTFILDILEGTTPTIEELGLIDAAPIAGDIFNQVYDANFTPWSGTILFPFLGIDTYFREWMLTEDTVATYKPLAGTYDLISATASVVPLSGNLTEVAVNVLETFGLFGSLKAFAISKDLENRTNEFMEEVYQLRKYDFELDLGGDLFDAGAKSANYIMGSLSDDHYSSNPDDNFSVVGSSSNDVIHAGLGDDYIFGLYGNDLIDGGEGDDVIDTGFGDDLVRTGNGADMVIIDQGSNVILDGTSEDRLFIRGSTLDIDKVNEFDRLFPLLGGTASYIKSFYGDGTEIVPDIGYYDTDRDGNIEYWYSGRTLSVEPGGGGQDIIINDHIFKSLGLAPFNVLYEMEKDDLMISIYLGNELRQPHITFESDPISHQWNIEVPFEPLYSVTLVDFEDGDFGITLLGPEEVGRVTIDSGQIANQEAIDAHNAAVLAINNNGVLNKTLGPVTSTAPLRDGVSGAPVVNVVRYGISNDEIIGTEVDETIYAEAGDDIIDGGAGDDEIYGGFGDDIISGGSGRNNLSGGAGFDLFLGGSGEDIIDGESGEDTVDYSASSSGIAFNFATGFHQGGDAENDELSNVETIIATSFDDSFSGSEADEHFIGGAGEDLLSGASGNDTLEGGKGADTIDGGEGQDRASYVSSNAGVAIDLVNQLASGGDAEGDTLTSIEGAIGSAFNDFMLGDDLDNDFNGKDGADIIFAGAGDDVVEGGAGSDTLDGGNGNDTLSYEGSNAGVTVNLSTDDAEGGDAEGDSISDFENLTGSSHDDTLTGTVAYNILNGGAGNDIFIATDGGDGILGGAGSDTIAFTASASAVTANITTIDYSGGLATGIDAISIENLIGSDHDDSLTGDDGTNILAGGSGNDVIEGGKGDDIIDGGAGDNDTAIFSGNVSDYLITNASEGSLQFKDKRDAENGASNDGVDLLAGIENFTFANGTLSLAELTITNSGPEASDDIADPAIEDQPITIAVADLLQNDNDHDGDPLTLTGIITAKHGTAELNLDNTITFTPNFSFAGLAYFDYELTDGINPPVTARVYIDFTPVNDTPFAWDDTNIDLYNDGPTLIASKSITANDFEFDGDELTITSVTAITGGTAALTSEGDILFTASGTPGDPVILSYTVDDGTGSTSTAEIRGIVQQRFVFTANNDERTTIEGEALVITQESLLSNDNNSGSNAPGISRYSDITNGNLSFNDAGDIVFTPTPGFAGIASFTYRANNGEGGKDEALVTIIVEPDEANEIPTALDDTGFEGTEDASIIIEAATLLANDNDPDGDALSIISVSEAIGGTAQLLNGGAVQFTPNENYYGPASFRYTIEDGNGGLASAIASMTINAVNDAPTDLSINHNEIEENSPAATLIGLLSVSDNDEGDEVTYSITGGDGAALFTLDGARLLLRDGAALDFETTPSYTIIIEATDQGGLSTSQTLTINILDVLEGGIIEGTNTNDELLGTSGDDTISGLNGNDSLSGLDGDDILIGGRGADVIDGGAGNDTADYGTSANGVTIFLSSPFGGNGFGLGSDASFDSLISIENVSGSGQGDILFGNGGENVITGQEGNDYLRGGGGSDAFIFNEGDGRDTILDFQSTGNEADVMSISHSSFTDFAALSPYIQSFGFFNASTRIDFGNGDQVTLFGIKPDELNETHFDFI